jgi:hypothetical protein
MYDSSDPPAGQPKQQEEFVTRTFLIVPACALALVITAAAQRAPDARIAKGKYLTENVAMCIDCHTPRLKSGELDRKSWLRGSPLDFKPLHPMPWGEVAPGIAGLPDWTDDQALKLLMTGLGKDGKPLRPPMPPYKMNKEDATAVVAYLQSLKSK